MKIVSIICEYNPFHSGHKYQIQKIKKEIKNSKIIALMSGNFVQRGGCAILDKHTRAKIALKNGADLVLELSPYFSTQVAPIFALGAVSTLNSLNVVDYLCFGSESEDIQTIENFSKNEIDNKDYKDFTLKNHMKKGMSFIKAYSLANENTANTSNDILSSEYLKALRNTSSNITAYNIKRVSSSYNDQNLGDKFSSATAIRTALSKNDDKAFEFIDKDCKKYFSKEYLKFDRDFYKYIKYAIIKENINLKNIFEVNEGLENLLIKNCSKATDLNSLIELTKSKRYTYAKIRRMLFNILLDIKKSDINTIQKEDYLVPYVRVLGFNQDAREIIKLIKNSSNISLVNKEANYKPKTEYDKMFIDKDHMITQIYNLDKNSYYCNDFLTSPIYLKNL